VFPLIFHPFNPSKNLEEVWKREQAAETERKRTEARLKELREERDMEQYRAMQEDAGLAPRRSERVDFLYDQPRVASSTEDALLAGAPGADAAPAEMDKLASTSGPVVGGKLVNEAKSRMQAAIEAEARVQADPLLQIKKSELDAKRDLVKNKHKMDKLKEEIKLLKALKKKKKREAKHARREARRERRGETAASPPPSPPPQPRDSDRHRRDEPQSTQRRRGYSRSPSPADDRGRRRNYRDEAPRVTDDSRHENRRERRREKRRSPSRSRSRSPAWRERRRERPERRREARPAAAAPVRRQKVAMSAEERQRRLAAMQADAEELDQRKARELQEHRAKKKQEVEDLREQQEKIRKDAAAGGKAEFLAKAQRKSFLDHGETLDERLHRTRHYHQRGDLSSLTASQDWTKR
jgi:hypothetical protein